MAGSSFGTIFKITTWGESHGKGLGVVVDGCPAGLPLDENDIQKFLNRRKPGQSKFTTPRKEDDVVEILSCDLLGVIPEDTHIITSTNKGEPIVNDEEALAGKAYRNVARRIMGEDIPLLDLTEPKGFIDKIKNFFKKGKV